MTERRYNFILAGNGPYDNRGCEAIVRGTSIILNNYFDKSHIVAASIFQEESQYRKQVKGETDSFITHQRIYLPPKRYSFSWWLKTPFNVAFPCIRRKNTFKDILPLFKDSEAVLSIGGDNYSLDYGIPKLFTDLDNVVLKQNKPLIIWGASVGPFSKMPEYEKFMINHLQTVTAIFVRETETLNYLSDNGIINNLFRVADPAFLMMPNYPLDIEVEDGSVGINLSPLMAKYVTDGNLKKWTEVAATIIIKISERLKRKIYLVPHVTSPHSNDYEFLKNITSLTNEKRKDILLLPDTLNAAEIKGVISKLSVFAGARMHSTIAALSTAIPTLSFAYSAKAMGINKDIFGDTRYCLNPTDIRDKIIVEKIEELCLDRDKISNFLRASMPKITQLSMDAGKHLKTILEQHK